MTRNFQEPVCAECYAPRQTQRDEVGRTKQDKTSKPTWALEPDKSHLLQRATDQIPRPKGPRGQAEQPTWWSSSYCSCDGLQHRPERSCVSHTASPPAGYVSHANLAGLKPQCHGVGSLLGLLEEELPSVPSLSLAPSLHDHRQQPPMSLTISHRRPVLGPQRERPRVITWGPKG